MTVEERQRVYLHALLTECWKMLHHAIMFSEDPECTKLISAACIATEKAKAYNERNVDKITNWEEEEKQK